MPKHPIEFGSMGAGLGGLTGMDILLAGQFLLDLAALELRRVSKS